MMSGPRVVLASASPRRRRFLADLGFCLEVVPSGVDETQVDADTPRATAIQLAYLKVTDVARGRPAGDVVVGADTVVVLGDRVLGKPQDARDARAMLSSLRGKTHRVITGVAVARAGAGCLLDACETAVTMRTFSGPEMEDYIRSGEPMDKAGAYAIQGRGASLVARHEGCWCNVVGLPLICLLKLLRQEIDLQPTPLPCSCAEWPHRLAGPPPWEKWS